jgi:hypothetical protein
VLRRCISALANLCVSGQTRTPLRTPAALEVEGSAQQMTHARLVATLTAPTGAFMKFALTVRNTMPAYLAELLVALPAK